MQDADGLTNFACLGVLDAVNGIMTISSNNALTSFTGLDVFSHVEGNLTISSNPALPLASAQAFANQITVKGSVTIN